MKPNVAQPLMTLILSGFLPSLGITCLLSTNICLDLNLQNSFNDTDSNTSKATVLYQKSRIYTKIKHKVKKVKQSRYRPGVTQRVPGS
jgi:hypothetical protein